MTNTNNTVAAIAAEILATTETHIELRAAELHDVDCFRQLCASAVAWLDAEYFGQADDDEEHATSTATRSLLRSTSTVEPANTSPILILP